MFKKIGEWVAIAAFTIALVLTVAVIATAPEARESPLRIVFAKAEDICKKGDTPARRIEYMRAIINYRTMYEKLHEAERDLYPEPHEASMQSSRGCKAARAVFSLKLPQRSSAASPPY